MLISLFSTPFDHFHFHESAGLVPKLILTPCHSLKSKNTTVLCLK